MTTTDFSKLTHQQVVREVQATADTAGTQITAATVSRVIRCYLDALAEAGLKGHELVTRELSRRQRSR